MVEIRPFKAYHYNLEKISSSPEKLFAPPYAVISEEIRQMLSAEPLNISNVTLGNRNDSYAHASQLLSEWTDTGILVSEDNECYYAYEQTFRLEDQMYRRTGLVALIRLEPMGKNILPHEKTHLKAKPDRLQHLQAVRGNLEQIFLIYDDPDDRINPVLERAKKAANELLSFTDFNNIRHRVFRICQESDISLISELLSDKRLLIADGHHRYETALHYSQLMNKEAGPGLHDYLLTTLINAHDPGLIMLPPHRLIHSLDDSVVDQLPTKLFEKFEIEKVDDKIVLAERIERQVGCGVLGFWFPKKKSGLLATLKPEFRPAEPLQRLDAFILHEMVLEELLGITPEMQEQNEKIEFVGGTDEAFNKASQGDYQVICLLNAPSVPEIIEIAETGNKMPHKSTYFYPKLWSGLIMYRH